MKAVQISQHPIAASKTASFKQNSAQKNQNTPQQKPAPQKEYNDPLMQWPVKGLAYTNEIGAAIHGVAPKLGTLMWVPALMYIGADIYDKYKNDETEYNPSKKRGVKEAVFQAGASVFLPTAAVDAGQRIASSLSRFSKTGLTAQTRNDVLEKSLDYMTSQSLHTFDNNPDGYIKGFTDSVLNSASSAAVEFKALPLPKKILAWINPFKDVDSLSHADTKKLAAYAEEQAGKVLEMRKTLMKNSSAFEAPKGISKGLFKKFKNIQAEYAKLYQEGGVHIGKAAKAALKEFHADQIFKNKLTKTAGGFIALGLMIKPIDYFVEHFIIKKTVEPGLDYLSQNYELYGEKFSAQWDAFRGRTAKKENNTKAAEV